MFRHQAVSVGPHLDRFVIHILPCCQYHGRVNLQRDGIGAVYNQDHAHGLCAAAALLQRGLVGLRRVTDRNQRPLCIEQPHFPNPEATFCFRDNLLSNNLADVGRVRAQGVNRSAAHFVNQPGLAGVRRGK